MQFLKNKFENFQGLKLVSKIACGLCMIGFAFAFFSCNLTSNGKTTQTVTFNSLYDSIKTDDSALIVFKTEDGKLLDTVFHGRIINKAGFANLPVANWDGGLVVIFITVYKDNKIDFQYERHVDGKTNQTTKSFITVAYHNGVDTIKVIPVDTTKNPPIDTTKVKPPDTTTQAHSDGINVSPRTLKLYTGGEVLALTAKVLPVTISQKVKWMSTNPTIAKVDDSGKVIPVAPGNIKVYATSFADTSKRDSADVTVKRDAPQVSVGQDTVVSLGKTVEFLPVVAPQEYGLVTQFKWDLNGDGTWDDSSATVKLVSYKYDQDKEYLVRFYVRDTEGNETIVTKKVKTSQGPVVLIKSPLNNSYTNKRTVAVVWSINDAIQDSLNTQVLKDSVNTIIRTAFDAAKKPFSNAITVYFDSVPPNKPIVHGNGLTNSLTPSWSWGSGGAGGNGSFRWAMDLEVFTNSPETKDTLYTPTVPLTEGVHTLYVQERDMAGNWSASGTLAIKIDKTPPAKPVVKVTEGGLTNVVKPTFTWASADGGNGTFQWKLDNQDLSFGAITTTDLSYLSAMVLASGQHTMYVRERDTTGNWSDLGSAQVTVDVDPPSAPILIGTTPTSSAPTWTWTTGGNGGSGDYRYKVGDANFSVSTASVKDLTYTYSGAATGNTYTLYVEEKDAAGNWSLPASKAITYDLSKPAVSIVSPQSSGTYLTSAGTLDVSGTSVSPQGAGSIKTVTYTIDGVAGALATNLVTATGAWSIKAVPLTNNKTIVIKVTATDSLGNSGEASLSLSMDNLPPAPPVFLTQPPVAMNNLNAPTSLQWTWSRTGDATDSFLVSLNGNIVSRQTGTSYTLVGPLDGTFQIQVIEKDLTGNNSTLASRNTAVLDKIPPSAPQLGNPTSPAKTASWTWTTGGGNGSGKYQCQLDNGTIAACTSPFPLPSPTDGVHNLKVQELDAVGNLSAWASSNVTIDLVSPSLSFDNSIPSKVFNTIPEISVTATDNMFHYVQYQVGANGTWITATQSGTTWTFTPALANGTQTVNIRAEDLAGNQTTKPMVLTWEPNVIFVIQGITTGAKDGSSWSNAYSDLGPLLTAGKTYSTVKQIWVSEGTYLPYSIDGFFFKPNLAIIGGFSKSGLNRGLAERDLSAQFSILKAFPNLGGKVDGPKRLISTPPSLPSGQPITDGILLSDFSFQNGDGLINDEMEGIYISGSNSTTLNNLTFNKYTGFHCLYFQTAKVDISNSQMTNNSNYEGVIYVGSTGPSSGSSIRILNTLITNNTHDDYQNGSISFYANSSLCLGGPKTQVYDQTSKYVSYGGAFSYDKDVSFVSGYLYQNDASNGTLTHVTSCPAPF